ncbi:MAG: FtsX-like permease family protein [Planctomycetaceae bacterium]|jgi:putative ABC transport system permease protein|nr:FtsX-like permease family protein [Planctomycetaceae bacterium]
MSLWKIAWRSIQHRSLASGLTAFSMGLGVALVVAVIVIYGVLDQTFKRSAQGYDLVVGPPKGSALDTVLGAVFYSNQLSDTIPYNYFKQIDTGRYSSHIEVAIPLAIGERLMVLRGLQIIATTPHFFTKLRYLNDRPYTFYKGDNLKPGIRFDAVLGYTAAKLTKLNVGDKFKATANTIVPSDNYPEPAQFEVVGILNPTGTPNDQAVFVNLEGFFVMIDHFPTSAVDEILKRSSEDKGLVADSDDNNLRNEKIAQPETDNKTNLTSNSKNTIKSNDSNNSSVGVKSTQKSRATENQRIDNRRISAILVLVKKQELKGEIKKVDDRDDVVLEINEGLHGGERMDTWTTALAGRLIADLSVQVASPTREITRLFELIVGRVQIVLVIFSILVVIVAGIGMMVSIYNSMNERRQEIAIMRALGAKRRTVMLVILFESILLSLCGGLIGVVIGHSLIAVLGPIIASAVMVVVNPLHFQLAELVLIPGLVILASLVGYLPAVVAYRTDVAQSLNP